MSYYKEKIKAFRIIEEMFVNGKSNEEIEYKISILFGFGAAMVKKRIELLKCISQKD
jgi:hypothetical protein